MDTMALSTHDMRETLDFLMHSNTHFGGTKVLLKHFERWSKKWANGERITVLDVGTGAGDLPLELSKWAGQKKFSLQITGIDIVSHIVAIARDHTSGVAAVQIERRDLAEVAAKGETFDYVISSLFLHHVPPEKQIATLQLFDRVARRGILISDLYRSLSGYLAVGAACYFFGNHITRHDGPLSVRRAFTVSELNQMAEEAQLPYLKAEREPWFRISLTGEKNAA